MLVSSGPLKGKWLKEHTPHKPVCHLEEEEAPVILTVATMKIQVKVDICSVSLEVDQV